MQRKILLVAGLALVPSLAAAQRGTRTQADKPTELFSKEDEQALRPTLRVSDLEDQSPLKRLIDKRKDLKLTDAQLAQLKSSQTALENQDAPLLKLADSLINVTKHGGSSDQDRANSRMAAGALSRLIEQLRTTFDSAGKAAVATLDAEQQPKATELLDKQREDGAKTIQKKLGGGSRGG